MKEFMGKDFLLDNDTAKELFEYSKGLAIFDYHCHLNPSEIAQNKHFKNITEMWLYGDHYKWRAMRSFGIDEYYITGDATDYEKFEKWAEVVPYLIGNPLYHWTHLELQRYFGIAEPLSPLNAKAVWDKANSVIESNHFCVFNIFKKFNVKAVCTTDDPIDSLEYHIAVAQNNECETLVLPTFRPDKAVNIESKDFSSYINKLSEVAMREILSYDDLLAALEQRLLFFKSVGCRISDHGCNSIYYSEYTNDEINSIFKKAMAKEQLTETQIKKYKSAIISDMGKKYHTYDIVMQLHMNVMRNNNEKMFGYLGADSGFDSVNDDSMAKELSALLNSMDKTGELPKTILYTLNPKDNYVLASMLGNFQGDGTKGKIQFGSGWWFCDQKDGMINQMTTLASLGVLPAFIGMLTDSRSFLSYPRHEYFRRILCNLVGTWVENGEYPHCMELLKKIISDIAFDNAKKYLNM